MKFKAAARCFIIAYFFHSFHYLAADSMDWALSTSKVVALPATLVFCIGGSKLKVYKMTRDENPTCPNGWEVAGFVLATYLAKLFHDRVDADTTLRELAQVAKKELKNPQEILYLDLARNFGAAQSEIKKFFPGAHFQESSIFDAAQLKRTLADLTSASKQFDLIVVGTHGTGEFGDASNRQPLNPEQVGRHDVLKKDGFLLWLGCGALKECSLDQLKESASMLTHQNEVKVVGSQYIVETGAGEFEEIKMARPWYYIAAPIAYVGDGIYSILNTFSYGGTGVRAGLGATIKRTLPLSSCRIQLEK